MRLFACTCNTPLRSCLMAPCKARCAFYNQLCTHRCVANWVCLCVLAPPLRAQSGWLPQQASSPHTGNQENLFAASPPASPYLPGPASTPQQLQQQLQQQLESQSKAGVGAAMCCALTSGNLVAGFSDGKIAMWSSTEHQVRACTTCMY